MRRAGICQLPNVYVHHCIEKGVRVYSLHNALTNVNIRLLLDWQIWRKKSPEGYGKHPIQVVMLFPDVAADFSSCILLQVLKVNQVVVDQRAQFKELAVQEQAL